jgi:Family of unknown function (DUF6476)
MRDQPQGDLRGLKALVGIMGVLIVLGTALVIGVVIHRLYARNPAPSNSVAAFVPLPGAGKVQLAPGEKIAGIAGAGGAVAVWVSGPAGDRLLLLDPASGQAREVLRTAPR